MLKNLPVDALLERVAANEPVPGGGSLSALAGAAAAALAEMVAGLTAGRPRFQAVGDEMKRLGEQAGLLRDALLTAVDRDADAYAAVMAAYRLPKATDSDKARRAEAIQAATREAALVPLSVAEKALEVLKLAGTAVRKGNPNAVTDAVVGAMLARSAALGAVCNVRINLAAITDPDVVEKLSRRAERLEADVIALEKDILDPADL